jgi:hypothetical protein
MERRRHKRFHVVDLDLFVQGKLDHVGKIINISRGGLLINASSVYSPGEIFDFFIPFSQAISGKVDFKFTGKISWCLQHPLNASVYSVGMEFIDIPEIQHVFLEQMIKIYGKNRTD